MRTQGPFGATATMQLSQTGPMCSQNINPTQHWKSNYRGTTADSAARDRLISTRPMWSINRQGYSSSRGIYKTEFQETIGKFGHNPRNILPHEAEKQSNTNNELSIGTQKVTKHIPGYSGFIPNTDINKNAVQ